MKKSNIRDYATEAFRFYAALGKPSYDSVETTLRTFLEQERQRHEVAAKGIGKPTEQAIFNAQAEFAAFEAELNDLLAVEKTMQILSTQKNGADIKRAVDIVYFTQPNRPIQRGEIIDRVHWASLAIPTTEPTVWRYLKAARHLFAHERGLRDTEIDSSRFKLSDIMVSCKS